MEKTPDLEDKEADVYLTWLDFVYAFKEIQYQNGAARDRDWYKLNPSDIFLAGCETIAEDKDKIFKMNTIVISMENLRTRLMTKPKLLEDVVQFLFTSLINERPSKSYLYKKISSILSGFLKTTFPYRLSFWIYPILYEKFVEDGSILQSIPEGEEWMAEINNAIANQEQIIHLIKKPFKLQAAMVRLTKLRISFWLKEYKEHVDYKLYILKLVCIFFEHLTEEFIDPFFKIIDILLVILFRTKVHKNDDGELNIFEEYGDWILKIHQKFTADYNSEVFGAFIEFHLLDMLVRIDSVESVEAMMDMENLTVIIDVLQSFVKDFDEDRQCVVAADFFKLLSSGLEMEISRDQILLIHLPNITAIGFGYKNGEIVHLLLQYGIASFTSKYHKELFTKSLAYIRNVHQLFGSHDMIRAENEFIKMRIESLTVAMETIDQLLALLPSSEIKDGVCEQWVDSSMAMEVDESACFTQTDDYILLLKSLLRLACLMVRSTSNIDYTFASLLPKLFYRTDFPDIPTAMPLKYFPECVTRTSVLPWKVAKHRLALDVLDVCIACSERQVGSTFQICGVMIPKLVRNLDRTGLDDISKYRIIRDFLAFCTKKMKSSQHVNTLITHGLDLISLLMPMPLDDERTAASEESGCCSMMKQFLLDIAESVETLGETSSLLLLKTACETLISKVPKVEQSRLKTLFLVLVRRCNRNDIRNIFLLSRDWLVEDRFDRVRDFLYSFGEKKMNSKALQALSELLTTVVSVEEKLRYAYPHLPNIKLDWIVCEITEPNIKNFNLLLKDLLRLFLYQALIPEKLEIYLQQYQQERIDDEPSNLTNKLDSELPGEVVGDDRTMDWLQTCIRRINLMQVPRYIKLQSLLSQLVKKFIEKHQISVEENTGFHLQEKDQESQNLIKPFPRNADDKNETEPGNGDGVSNLLQRHQEFENHVKAFPWNVKKRDRLVSKCGYSNQFWSTPIQVEVVTDGLLNLDENLRRSLLSCYGEYVEILNTLSIPAIVVDGASVKTDDIFNDDLSLVDLKGRRSVVVKTIDKKLNGRDDSILEKKFTLQMREEQIEKDLQEMASKPTKPQTFQIKLNTTFYDCSLCCGAQIIGCYSPVGGEHCERPLEIGFRADSGFISIYHNGVEIENSEVLLMDEGLFLYKAYTSGHPYDTSEVWMKIFIELLDVEEVVPAIILPHHFPNKSTWEGMNRWVSPDVVSTYINCDFDYSNDWRTYYDSRPETIGNNKDIILTKGFTSKERRTSFSFQRQISVNDNKDLGGMLSDHVMQQLLADSKFKTFRFLGKQFVMLLNNFVDTGKFDITIISNNFNVERWKKTLKDDTFKEHSKEDVIKMLNEFLLRNVQEYLDELNVETLLFRQRRQFHQVRSLLLKNRKSKTVFAHTRKLLVKLEKLLLRHLSFIRIDALSENMQDELIHWIFENEDRVWRYRGGREFETISQFLSFLSHHNKDTRCFPGVIVYLSRENINKDRVGDEGIKVSDVVGYAIGEYVDDDDEFQVQVQIDENDVYEIITAWVHPSYRGLKLSTEIYLEIFKRVASKYVTLDLLRHRVDHVIKSSFVLRLLGRLFGKEKLLRMEKSYEVATEKGVERFEKVTIIRPPIAFCLRLRDNYLSIFVVCVSFLVLVVGVLLSAFVFHTS